MNRGWPKRRGSQLSEEGSQENETKEATSEFRMTHVKKCSERRGLQGDTAFIDSNEMEYPYSTEMRQKKNELEIVAESFEWSNSEKLIAAKNRIKSASLNFYRSCSFEQ